MEHIPVYLLAAVSAICLIACWWNTTEARKLFNDNRALQSRIRSVEYRHWDAITQLEERITKQTQEASKQFGPPVKVGIEKAAARHDQVHETRLDNYGQALADLVARLDELDALCKDHTTRLGDRADHAARIDELERGLNARFVDHRVRHIDPLVRGLESARRLLNDLKAEADRCCERLDALEAYQPPDEIEQWDGQLDKIKLNVLEILELHEARLNVHRTALDIHETRLDGVVSVPGVYGRVDDTETEEAS